MNSGPPSGALQLVYISLRPDLVAESLASFKRHYRADRAVILTGDGNEAPMRAALARAGFSGTVVEDSQLLPGHRRYGAHAERNIRLRQALYRHAAVEEYFLALDDDCILLHELPADHFVAAGRMIARYTHPSLDRWKSSPLGDPGSFDLQQWNTHAILSAAGLPEIGYAAHQAQIMDKATVNGVYEEFLKNANGPVCEWALYFNVAVAREPARFVAKPATTLFWPESFDSWLPERFEADIHFENRYPWMYQPGGALASSGLKNDSDWRLKAGWAAARFAVRHSLRQINELANGAPPQLTLTAGAMASNAGQLFGHPGLILKLGVDCPPGDREPVEYAVLSNGSPVAECASPVQRVGPRQDLAVRLPREPGEYIFVAKWAAAGKEPAYLSLPLFVLPCPPLF